MTAATVHVEGAPDGEHGRSPAALRVAQLAARSGLLLAHYEKRVRLPPPGHWLPDGRPDLGDSPGWRRGVLAEPKYLGFRHDQLIGSFHPSHRAKWTAHELCHGLVGFAWRPGASDFFHALAAWLAELLPVTLWYFWDEAGLRRCPAHQGGGPLFNLFCARCERAAGSGARPWEPADDAWVARGRKFLDRELAAIARARRTGRPVGTRHATVDLASDALAYAASHSPRLGAESFERYAALFFGPNQGRHEDLDALEARVLEVAAHLCGDGQAAPLSGDRDTWIAQDLGARLLCVREQTDGEAGRELDRLCERLGAARDAAAIDDTVRAYLALHDEWTLPSPDEVFGVGYPVAQGYGFGHRQLAEGLASACPRAWQALAPQAAVCARFAREDPCERRPLGRRFAAWLTASAPGPVAEMATYEAALSHAAPPDPVASSLRPSPRDGRSVRLAQGAELLSLRHDVLADAPPAELPRRPAPLHLALAQTPAGEVEVVELPGHAADALRRAGDAGCAAEDLGLDEHALATLLDLRVITPCAYALS